MITRVVGTTYENPDGSSRGKYIASMTYNDKVCLERDTKNLFDKNAIKVCLVKNGEVRQIGFIKAEIAAELAPRMDNGEEFTVEVLDCGVYENKPYCEIYITEV